MDECLRLLGEVIMEQACGARTEPILAICRQKLADLSVRAPGSPADDAPLFVAPRPGFGGSGFCAM